MKKYVNLNFMFFCALALCFTASADAGKEPGPLADFQPDPVVQTISQGNISVEVDKNGQLLLNTAKQSCLVAASYSYQGQKIGWNKLSSDPSGSEANWSVQVVKVSPRSLQIEANGKFYNIQRTVSIKDGKITFEDRLTNLDVEPVGVNVWNTLTYRNAFLDKVNLGRKGYGANPSFFLAGEHGNTGVRLEDNVSRMRYDVVLGVPANQARFKVIDLVLDVGKSMTYRWSIYPLAETDDHFSFINRLRRELKTNFTIEGPFAFLKIGAKPDTGHDSAFWIPWEDPEQLKSYLQHRPLKIVVVLPFMDYDPGALGHVWPRDVYKKEMQ